MILSHVPDIDSVVLGRIKRPSFFEVWHGFVQSRWFYRKGGKEDTNLSFALSFAPIVFFCFNNGEWSIEIDNVKFSTEIIFSPQVIKIEQMNVLVPLGTIVSQKYDIKGDMLCQSKVIGRSFAENQRFVYLAERGVQRLKHIQDNKYLNDSGHTIYLV